ncbi:hypothetical protein [Moraxella lacunata]|uniref:hypothetical protein n=1 Tax=Moraxella lacunata TaxID=477 RepID=UPI003EE29495
MTSTSEPLICTSSSITPTSMTSWLTPAFQGRKPHHLPINHTPKVAQPTFGVWL